MEVCTRENTPSFFNLLSMLLLEENHVGMSKTKGTWRKREPVVLVYDAGLHAMVATNMRKSKGTVTLPTTVPDPPEAETVKKANKG